MAGADPLEIDYKASAAKDLARIDRSAALRIVGKIEKALAERSNPRTALQGEFKGLFRLRVGDYRVIYTLTRRGYLVLRIGHRRDVYRQGRP